MSNRFYPDERTKKYRTGEVPMYDVPPPKVLRAHRPVMDTSHVIRENDQNGYPRYIEDDDVNTEYDLVKAGRMGQRSIAKIPTQNRQKQHDEKSPKMLLMLIMGMLSVLTLMFLVTTLFNWYINWSYDQKYGFPRIYQTDAVVGHNDNAQNPSHFIAQNLSGRIVVVEFQGGNPGKSFTYSGPNIYDGKVPVILSFKDLRGNGKIDMIVTLVGKHQLWVLFNSGKEFDPKSQPSIELQQQLDQGD